MEKRIMANICRGLVVTIAFSFAALAAHAQLINGGFETAGTNYVFPDNGDGSFPFITNLFAAGWIPNGGAYVSRDATNAPQQGEYEDTATSYDFVGVNATASNTAHSGTYALRCFGPFQSGSAVGSGAYQLIMSNSVPAISNNTIWVLNGYGLNWSGDQMQDTPLASVNYGQLQILFVGTNGNVLNENQAYGPELGTNTAVNTWISCSVTGQAPPRGTAGIEVFALHVGQAGALGSIFWDDLSLTNIGVGAPPPPTVTNFYNASLETGNQICWSTVTTASYQPQYSDDNVNWTNLGSLVPGDGTTDCTFSLPHKFYRVEAYVTSSAPNLLLNPGFETTTDGVTATDWTEFNGGVLVSTNATFAVVHSGLYSMSATTPNLPGVQGGGAYQDVAASPGSNYRLTGYLFDWENSKMEGPDRYAVAQLVFLDNTGGTGNVLQVNSSPAYGNGAQLPENTWVFFQVDATNAPANTAKVRTYVMYIGGTNDSGNVYYDDLTLYQPSGAAPSTIAPSQQSAVQVSWPNSPLSEGDADYQIQSVTNLVFPAPQMNTNNVLVNPGFETGAVSNDTVCPDYITPITGWTLGGNGGHALTTSGGPNFPDGPCIPAHSGIGCLSETANENPPVVYQPAVVAPNYGYPATPGQIWQFTAYGYVCETICGITPSADMRGLLKIVWNDVNGNGLQPVNDDTNLVGSLDTGEYPGITSSPQLSGSQVDTWISMEAQATAPPGTAFVVFYNIDVGSAGQMLFDDEVALQVTNTTTTGWQNLGPLWAKSAVTNTITDPITTKQKFYRVTTP
jgi:hypothetical protein